MENKKSKKIIIAVICAVVAVALVVAILAITGVFSKDPNEDPSNSTTTTTSKYDPTKYVVQGIDDKSYLVLLDEKGNAIINDKNQIVVVDRDKNGEIIKDENGEPQTHLEQIDDKYVVKDKIYTADYEINVIEGWEAFGSGYIRKLDTNVGGTLMKCTKITGADYASMTLDEYLKQHNAKLQKKYETQKKNGFTTDYSEKEITILDNVKAYYCTEKIVNKNGGLTNYSEILYFEIKGNKYRFEFALSDDANYNANKDFDFVDYVNNNFIVK